VPAHERTPAGGPHVLDARQVHLSERTEIETRALGVGVTAGAANKPG
jgi:hypothetical protein